MHNFITAFSELLSNEDLSEIKVKDDNKFYIRKSIYQIQIHSIENSVWLEYVTRSLSEHDYLIK